MTRFAPSFASLLTLAVAALVATSPAAHAAGLFADQDVDSRFKAKIMKEKAKQNQQVVSSFNFNQPGAANAGRRRLRQPEHRQREHRRPTRHGAPRSVRVRTERHQPRLRHGLQVTRPRCPRCPPPEGLTP